jgi:hypothetical protein
MKMAIFTDGKRLIRIVSKAVNEKNDGAQFLFVLGGPFQLRAPDHASLGVFSGLKPAFKIDVLNQPRRRRL